MAYCSNCGSPLADNAKFCPNCGAAAARVQEAAADESAADAAAPAESAVAAVRTVADAFSGFAEAPDTMGEFVAGTWDGNVVSTAAAAVSSAGAAVASTKKKSKLPLVIGDVAAVAVIAIVALYVVPLFSSHPHDPNTGKTSPAASSQSAQSARSAQSAQSARSAASSTTGTPSSSAAASANATSASGFSTSEWPTLAEFTWLTGEAAKGNVPAGATRLTDLDAVTGGWKAYLYDSDMEWLLRVTIEAGQADVIAALDWYYLRPRDTGQSREDTTPTSFFSGTWDSGMLDAFGSGRVTLAAFWQQDGHQYAAGSLMWSDGNVSTLVLMRP